MAFNSSLTTHHYIYRAMPVTDAGCVTDSIGDEVFGGLDCLFQSEAAPQVRSNRCGECAACAVRTGRLNPLSAKRSHASLIVQHVKSKRGAFYIGAFNFRLLPSAFCLLSEVSAFDQHGARSHLSHNAGSAAHSVLVLYLQTCDALGFGDVRSDETRERHQFCHESLERIVVNQIVAGCRTHDWINDRRGQL